MSRIAVVTGGTRGLGRAISVGLKLDGFQVAALYGGHHEAAELFHEETSIPVYHWDVSSFQDCVAGVKRVEAELGSIDILVNNAGITRDAVLHRMSEEQWNEVMCTNLGSMFNMCRNVIEGMRERGFGRIVNISSINGEKGQVGQVNYAASKAGVLGFTRALALESACKGITVNAVAPGYCETEMIGSIRPELLKAIVAGIPCGRLGRPEDVAQLVSLLVGEGAGFITGATFDVNGGQWMS